MISLEKALIVRQLPFLKNEQRLTLAESLSERELYQLNQDLLEEVLQMKFSRKIHWRRIYPKVIHSQIYLLQLQGIDFLIWNQEDYPDLLKEIYDPPFMLFYKGVLPKLPTLAVVGARKACMEAIKRTRELGRELAKTNVCVVSGLAYGVDTAIHEGLTEEGGQSFSVLATPLDNIYPKSNRSLAGAILYHGGGLLSETAPLESVGKYTFVKRNRIISGLSLATLVMAAEKKSGALLTAQFAVDEGREVFIWNDEHAGEGALTFLEQGAQTFISLHDLSSVLRINFREPTLALATNRLVGFKEKEIGKRAIEDSLVEDLLKELNS